MLPRALNHRLSREVLAARKIHDEDLKRGYGAVHLPYALHRKYQSAATSFVWQYVLPAAKLSIDPKSGKVGRHHVNEQNVQRAVKDALRAAGVRKNGTCHAFRHSFATHLVARAADRDFFARAFFA